MARPAALFVQEAQRHACQIVAGCGGKTANAKSILQVLALGVNRGAEVVISTDGEGEEAALVGLVGLVGAWWAWWAGRNARRWHARLSANDRTHACIQA